MQGHGGSQGGDYQQYMKQYSGDYQKYMQGQGGSKGSDYQQYMKQYSGDYQKYMQGHGGSQGGDYQQYMKQYSGDYQKYMQGQSSQVSGFVRQVLSSFFLVAAYVCWGQIRVSLVCGTWLCNIQYTDTTSVSSDYFLWPIEGLVVLDSLDSDVCPDSGTVDWPFMPISENPWFGRLIVWKKPPISNPRPQFLTSRFSGVAHPKPNLGTIGFDWMWFHVLNPKDPRWRPVQILFSPFHGTELLWICSECLSLLCIPRSNPHQLKSHFSMVNRHLPR